VNETLTTKEMIEFFGVSKDVWKRNRNKLLENFGKYYEYEVVYRGRNIDYHIIRKIDEYKPIEKKSEKRDRVYESNILDVIAEDNIQTAMNVSRIIKDNDDIKELNHSDGTVYEYTRVRMRNMFGVVVNEGGTKGIIEKKVWCKLVADYNYYVEMSEEEIQDFYDIYKQSKEDMKEEELEIFSDYQNGLITKDEMNSKLGECGLWSFKFARKQFADKHKYFPIKVPVYRISAFEMEEV
jgi:hypothetical protein